MSDTDLDPVPAADPADELCPRPRRSEAHGALGLRGVAASCGLRRGGLFDLERDRLWWREWVAVGRAEQLRDPGDFLGVDVAGERVIVVRDRAGELSGHYDLCRHRGSRLTTPDQRADPVSCTDPGPTGHFKGVIRCVYHSWCYELDGAVRNAPYLGEAEHFDAAAFGLYPVAIDTWGGWIFVNLAPERVAEGYSLAVAAWSDPGPDRALPARRPPERSADRLRRRRQLEGHRRELQRVLSLRRRASRSSAGSSPHSRSAAARTWTGTPACRRRRARSRSR